MHDLVYSMLIWQFLQTRVDYIVEDEACGYRVRVSAPAARR